jgi:hypothetical protein
MLSISVNRVIFGNAVDVIIENDEEKLSLSGLFKYNKNSIVLNSGRELQQVIEEFGKALIELKNFAEPKDF